MRIVIVYESLFGCTRDIAHAVADAMATADPRADITCVRATEAVPEQLAADHHRGRVDLLVVGGPTHTLGMSSARSRRTWLGPVDDATRRGRLGHPLEPDADQPALREWFQFLPPVVPGSRAAAFDTRLDRLMAGGAAGRIARRLRRHGYELIAPPEGFLVGGKEGPLCQGELDRARAWARQLLPLAVA